MPLPTILLGIVLSTLYGAAFHVLRGGSMAKLLFYLLLAWAGFWTGNQLAIYFGWTFWAIGVLNAGAATMVSLVLLVIGEVISRILAPATDEE
jgi:hypothetical protein